MNLWIRRHISFVQNKNHVEAQVFHLMPNGRGHGEDQTYKLEYDKATHYNDAQKLLALVGKPSRTWGEWGAEFIVAADKQALVLKILEKHQPTRLIIRHFASKEKVRKYNPSSETLEEANYVDGLRHGVELTYKKGKVSERTTFKHGVCIEYETIDYMIYGTIEYPVLIERKQYLDTKVILTEAWSKYTGVRIRLWFQDQNKKAEEFFLWREADGTLFEHRVKINDKQLKAAALEDKLGGGPDEACMLC